MAHPFSLLLLLPLLCADQGTATSPDTFLSGGGVGGGGSGLLAALQQFMALVQAQAEVFGLLAAVGGVGAAVADVVGDGILSVNVVHGCIP